MQSFVRSLTVFVFLITAPFTLHAAITLRMDVYQDNDPGGVAHRFAFPILETTGGDIPLTHHHIESPTGAFQSNHTSSNNFGTTSSSFTDFPALIAAVTNGEWKLVLNSNHVSQVDYTFGVSVAGLDSNTFPQVEILFPEHNATGVSTNPVYAWAGPGSFDELTVNRRRPNYSEYVGQSLPTTATNWATAPALGGGTYEFEAEYILTNATMFSFTTPVDGGLTPLPNWSAGARLRSYSTHAFETGATDPLAEALDNPDLVWTTGGDADWFSQTDETNDGEDAAQSGFIGDDENSWIETTVVGPGTLSFYWNVSSDDFDSYDYLELYVVNDDDEYWDEIAGEWGWDYYEVPLDPGTNTIRWTYQKDSEFEAGADAAWLDEVVFIPEISVDMTLTIQCTKTGTNNAYLAFPALDYVDPPSVTSHEVESPSGLFGGDEWSSSSVVMPTLQSVIDECEAGDWTLYINRFGVSERQYTFTVSAAGLDTNDVPAVIISSPADAAVDVSTTPAFAWAGPTNYASLFVSAFHLDGGASGSQSLPSAATTWTNAPTLDTGTNEFRVTYTDGGFAGVTFSEPEDDRGNPLSFWFATADLQSSGTSVFVVGAGLPQPLWLTGIQGVGGQLQFALQTEAGRAHDVQCRTNMLVGTWSSITNVIGDGSLKLIQVPLGPGPEAYYRVESQ